MIKNHPDHPENDPELAEVIREIRGWSGNSPDAPKTDVNALLAALDQIPVEQPVRRDIRPLAYLSWILSAAAVLVVALTQVQFEFSWGESRLSIGTIGVSEIDKGNLVTMEEVDRRINSKQAEIGAAMADLSRRAAELELFVQQSTQELAQNQVAESMTRYNDIQTLLSMTAHGR